MRAIERVYRAEAARYLATGRTRIVCSALLSTAYLSETGQVYPCTIWDKPLGKHPRYRLCADADHREVSPGRGASRGRRWAMPKLLDALRSLPVDHGVPAALGPRVAPTGLTIRLSIPLCASLLSEFPRRSSQDYCLVQ